MASNSAIESNQLVLLPGQSVLLQNISWSKFAEIISELGEHHTSKLAYDQEMLEIMVPLPEHEYFKDAIGDLVKDLALELASAFCLKASNLPSSPKVAKNPNSIAGCRQIKQALFIVFLTSL